METDVVRDSLGDGLVKGIDIVSSACVIGLAKDMMEGVFEH